ncbi:Ig-like domain-containing protein [Rhodocaloribacter sp.]
MQGYRIHPFITLIILIFIFPAKAQAQNTVSLPVVSGAAGDQAQLPVTVSDLSGQGVIAYDFTISYDPAVLQLTGVSTTGTLSDGWSVSSNQTTPGVLVVSAASANAADGGGTLLLIEADYLSAGTSPLTWTDFVFNEGSPSATLTDGSVTVTGGNTDPSATDDTVMTDEDTPVEIDVLDNDTDPDGDDLTLTAVTDPEHGEAEIIDSNKRIRYTPEADFFGDDSFTYTISDGNGGTDSATVSVTVDPVNDPPAFIASPVFISPAEGATIIIGGGDGQDPVNPDAVLKVEWNPATDPDGDETSYTWQLSSVEDFSVMLLPNDDLDTNVGASTFFEIDYGTLAALLTDNGVDLFGSITVFHRVVASDGQVQTMSDSASITLMRGAIVATENDEDLPETYMLLGNYPNPFNPVTTFRFALPQSDHIRISVYNILGQQVSTLADGVYSAGWHSVRWDASGFVSGIYFVHMTGSGFIGSQTATLLK